MHEQSTSNATWIFRIQRNIETWKHGINQQTLSLTMMLQSNVE